MGILFVNQNGNCGWIPKDEVITAVEELLEEKTKQKAIFLPSGCNAHCTVIEGEDFFVIEQTHGSALVTEDVQKEIVKKINEKAGKKSIFLPPGCTLSHFE